jgi:hypothetical protein
LFHFLTILPTFVVLFISTLTINFGFTLGFTLYGRVIRFELV